MAKFVIPYIEGSAYMVYGKCNNINVADGLKMFLNFC